MSTITMPPKKAIEALIFFRWKKNRNVRSNPMTQANPQMNKIWIKVNNLKANVMNYVVVLKENFCVRNVL